MRLNLLDQHHQPLDVFFVGVFLPISNSSEVVMVFGACFPTFHLEVVGEMLDFLWFFSPTKLISIDIHGCKLPLCMICQGSFYHDRFGIFQIPMLGTAN